MYIVHVYMKYVKHFSLICYIDKKLFKIIENHVLIIAAFR